MTPSATAPTQLFPGLDQATYHVTMVHGIDTILKLIQYQKDFVNRAHPNMPPSATGPTQLYPGLGQAITMLPWYLELILYLGLGQATAD